MSYPRQITADELEPLATGAWILGAGGGGSPYLSYLNLRQYYRAGKPLTLVDPQSLADDALVAVVSNMGAPLVGQERLCDPAFAAKPVRMMEDHLKRPFDAVMSVEIGGGNALQPLLVASVTGLPVVDGDAMGRAFPEAQMTSFAIGDLPMFPLTLADIRDNEVIIAARRLLEAGWSASAARSCTEVGSVAATCKAPRSGPRGEGLTASSTPQPRPSRMGRAVMASPRTEHRRPGRQPILDAAGRSPANFISRQGQSTWSGAPPRAFCAARRRSDGLGGRRPGSRVPTGPLPERVLGRLASAGEPVVMTVPDLICVIDSVSGRRPSAPTSMHYGQRVNVMLALPAPPVFLTPAKGLAQAVGPRAFGFDLDFRSVFDGAAP